MSHHKKSPSRSFALHVIASPPKNAVVKSSVCMKVWISVWVLNFAAVCPVAVAVLCPAAVVRLAVDVEDNRNIPQEPVRRPCGRYTQRVRLGEDLLATVQD